MKQYSILLNIFFSLTLILLMSNANAQNVGIGTTTPQAKLDVNGNVNVGGNLLVNGVAGTAGQVLQTNSAGATAWMDMGTYTYVVSFTQNGTFTVPAGVTRILIESWGAGGGGSSGGGGAAGVYLVSARNVTPGTVITITTGTGGSAATTNPGSGSDGGSTIISNLPGTLTALGGKGANPGSPGYATSFGISGAAYVQYTGQHGDANTVSYAQKNSTTFAVIRKYGDGGAAGPDYSRRSQGETRILNESTSVSIETIVPTFAPFPGGGGGGGLFGKDGERGMAIIRY